MKTIRIFAVGIMLMAMMAQLACRRNTVLPNDYSYVTFDTQCLGSSMDGTVRLKAWGTGPNRAAAIENAKRNALRDVIFKGIKSGSPECNHNPLTYEVNAQERYEQYFNAFFADGGAYLRYASLADETLTSRSEAKGRVQQAYSVVVTVDRAALQRRLIEDHVIKTGY